MVQQTKSSLGMRGRHEEDHAENDNKTPKKDIFINDGWFFKSSNFYPHPPQHERIVVVVLVVQQRQ